MFKNIYSQLYPTSIYVLSGKNGKHFKKQSQVSAEEAAKLKLFGAASMDFQPNSAETNDPSDANLNGTNGPIEEEDESSDDSSCNDPSDDEISDDVSMTGLDLHQVDSIEMTAPDPPKCVTLNEVKSDLNRSCFIASPQMCFFNGRNYALVSLLLPSIYDDSNTTITVSPDGRRCYIDFERKRESFSPSRITGFGLPNDHAAAVALDLYLKKLQGHHQENSIKGRITLKLPFFAEPHTSNDLLKARDRCGGLHKHGTRMPMVQFASSLPDGPKNYTRNLVICFKERDDGFTCNKKIKDHVLTTEFSTSTANSSPMPDYASTSGTQKRHRLSSTTPSEKTSSSSTSSSKHTSSDVVEDSTSSDDEMLNDI